MHIKPGDFRVGPDEIVSLEKWPTHIKHLSKSKAEHRERLRACIAELSAQQELFYANNQYSLLIIFQAMDAAGKDSAIKHVMSGINPQGCQVTSFKHPGAEALDHDFLWRASRHLPERGMIGIFNRSYFEEVLIVRVHPAVLKSQHLPPRLVEPKTIWRDRFQSILDLENHLTRNGTLIIKFFLHLSKKEQRRRLLRRIDRPTKNWKVSPTDLQERKCWNSYMTAYEECLSKTSTKVAPWYIVPADDKKDTSLIVSQIILDAFHELKMRFPRSTSARRKQLATLRTQL